MLSGPYERGVPPAELAAQLAPWMGVHCVLLFCAWAATPTRVKDRVATMDLIYSMVLFPVISYLSLAAVWRLHATDTEAGVEGRWAGVCLESHLAFVIYVSAMIVHCGVAMQKRSKRWYKCYIVIHHVFSCTAFVSMLLDGALHFWGVACLSCEVSNIFLTSMYLLKDLDVTGPLVVINSLLLWVSWVVCRVVALGIVIYVYWSDRLGFFEYIPRPLTVMHSYYYPFTTMSLEVLAIVFLVPITKGLVKVVGTNGYVKEDKNGKSKNGKPKNGKSKKAD